MAVSKSYRASYTQGSIKRACANVYQVKSLTCGTKAVVEVYGKHRLLPGDIVALEGIEDTSNTKANYHAVNREHTVHALPVDAGTDANRLDWDKIWLGDVHSLVHSSIRRFVLLVQSSIHRSPHSINPPSLDTVSQRRLSPPMSARTYTSRVYHRQLSVFYVERSE